MRRTANLRNQTAGSEGKVKLRSRSSSRRHVCFHLRKQSVLAGRDRSSKAESPSLLVEVVHEEDLTSVATSKRRSHLPCVTLEARP